MINKKAISGTIIIYITIWGTGWGKVTVALKTVIHYEVLLI